MSQIKRVLLAGSLIWLMASLSGCIVAPPHEGYYDRDHHRYYHEGGWHDCGEHSDFCR
jgi:hypothetical protein